MRATYRIPALKRLFEEQLLLPARRDRAHRAACAENLLSEIEPSQRYSLDYIRRRITNSPARREASGSLDGEAVRHDLSLMVEDLSDAANLSAEQAGEGVLTVEQLAEQLGVSTKTISRWRRLGLVSRRFVFDGQKRVGFLQSSVDRFVRHNREKVQRGGRFSKLGQAEIDAIIRDARDLARAGKRPSEIARRLSKKLDRDPETVRTVLRRFDQANPQNRVFPARNDVLENETRERLFRRYLQGESLESLAAHLGSSITSVRRVIRDVFYERIMDLDLSYIPNPLFDRIKAQNARKTILGPAPESNVKPKKVRLPGGLPAYLESMYHVPLLTREQEVHLFRKMNYMKHTANKLRQNLDPKRPRLVELKKIESLYNEAVGVKNELVRRNLRLVASIAKKLAGPSDTFFELISDGNISLMRAVDKFDYSRGFKFSTYATWAIRRNFARTIPDEFRRRERFNTGCDEYLETAEELRSDQFQEELLQSHREAGIQKVLTCLDDRERHIISDHFGLGGHEEPKTLEKIGKKLGISKERVRQLKTRAIEKMRAAASREKIDLPALAV